MLNVELIWVKECPYCNQNHSRTETARVDRVELIDEANALFEQHCEAWFENHLLSFNPQQLKPALGAAAAPGLFSRLLGTPA